MGRERGRNTLILPKGVCIGFSTNKGVMLDLDYITKKGAVRLADYLLERYKLEGYILLRSSKLHYHLVFNKPIHDWKRLMQILARVRKAQDWVIWQIRKGDITLRITKKNGKTAPILIEEKGQTDKIIAEYWNVRNYITETLLSLKV